MANQTNRRPAARSGGFKLNVTFIGAVFLGICVLIAGLNIGGSVRKLNKTMEDKVFAATNNMNVPGDMSISQKKYLNETEAGMYLNITREKVINLISAGEITEYVKTDEGYSISVQVLDEWFDNEAYQTKLKAKGASNSEEEDGGSKE